MNIKMKTLLNMTLSLSALMASYTAHALPSKAYQASVIANCSDARACDLLEGDILSTSKQSRAGLPLHNGMLFLGPNTEAKVLVLNSHFNSFYLIGGTLSLRVFETRSREVFQIKSGDLTISMRQAGYYRVSASSDGRSTNIQVMAGNVVVRSGKSIQTVRKGEIFSYRDNQRPVYRRISLPLYDEQYYFTINFMNGYYSQYPQYAPKIQWRSQPFRGPKVEIITQQTPVIQYGQPRNVYNNTIIIRNETHQNSEPVWQEKSKHESSRPGSKPASIETQTSPKPAEPTAPRSSGAPSSATSGTSPSNGAASTGTTSNGTTPTTNVTPLTPSNTSSTPNGTTSTLSEPSDVNSTGSGGSPAQAPQPGGYPSSNEITPQTDSDPDTSMPSSTIPSSNMPTIVPNSSVPSTTTPKLTEPDQDPDPSMPNSRAPDATMPNSPQPDATMPDENEIIGPDTGVSPQSSLPSSAFQVADEQSRFVDTKISDPKDFEPRASEPKQFETQGFKPKEFKPKILEPQEMKPKILEPKEMRDPGDITVPAPLPAPVPDSQRSLTPRDKALELEPTKEQKAQDIEYNRQHPGEREPYLH